jgi:hypothetical protein
MVNRTRRILPWAGSGTSPGFAVLATVALFVAGALAQATATTTQEGLYAVTRSETVVPAPGGMTGRKTITRETRVGNTAVSEGKSSSFVMTFGGFLRKCPIPDDSAAGQFVVPGDFEYSLTADDVDTREGQSLRTHYAKRTVARLKAHLRDDATIDELEIDAEYSSAKDGVQAAPIRDRRRFKLGQTGMPDMEALTQAVLVTGDVGIAAVMWKASEVYQHAQLSEWLIENACVELEFDPPSETRALDPNQSEQVRATLRTKEGKLPVPDAQLVAEALNRVGSAAPRQVRTAADGTVTVTYTASAHPKKGHGFEVTGPSRAGSTKAQWRIIEDGLSLKIEHRLVSRRDSPQARAGRPLYDGTIRFDIKLESLPTMPGEFRGETTVVRPFSVGHITPRCAGQGSQTETWRANATVDAASGTMKLGLDFYSDELTAFWVCDGQRSEVTSPFRSTLDLVETPLTMPSRSGSRQTFTPSGPLFQETLTVTIP